jgi:hypothetical protein
VIGLSRRQTDGSIHIPGAAHLRELLFNDLEAMMRPLEMPAADLHRGADAAEFRRRLERLAAALPAWDQDLVGAGDVTAMMSAGGPSPDSLHQLVMDLHRELNRLQAAVARESIDGARAYGLSEADRILVRAFAEGRQSHRGAGSSIIQGLGPRRRGLESGCRSRTTSGPPTRM